MVTNTPGTALVVGVGPGLGMSVARRFGREGYEVALVSRSSERQAGYLDELRREGVRATAYAADVREEGALAAVVREVRHGDPSAQANGTTADARPIDAVYYGPAAIDAVDAMPDPITATDGAAVAAAMSWVYPGIDLVASLLPGMLERGRGTVLFAGGLSAVTPMPALGRLAVSSAALRNYVLTLNAGLAEHGVYAGILHIGGVIERGDIHRMLAADPERFGDVGASALDPDAIADAAWDLAEKRDRAEATFSAFG